jgi:hypothetical protein
LTAYARIHSMAGLQCGRVNSFLLFVLIGLSGCASSPGELMIARRHAFEREFIPTVDRYSKFAEAALVYVTNVRRIATEVGWQLTDLDELGLLYVQAMSEYVDRGELARTEALFRMRLMEKMIMDEYARRAQAAAELQRQRALDAMTFWALWQSNLTAYQLREPVTCFQTGILITCR